MPKAGDIQEVETEIHALKVAVAGDWRSRSSDGLDAMIREIENDSGIDTKDVVALAAIALLLRHLNRPVTQRFRSRAKASAQRIILTGIRQSSLSPGRLRTHGPTIERASKQSAQAIVALSKARAQGERFQQRIGDNAEDLVAANRELKALKRLTESIEKDRKTEAAREKRRKKLEDAIKFQESARKSAIKGLRKTLSDRNGHMSTTISDFWAYRVYNLGVFLAARAAKIETLVAINPKDSNTTRFCNWVHGKTIKVVKVERRLKAYQKAIKGGDREDMAVHFAERPPYPAAQQGHKGYKGHRA